MEVTFVKVAIKKDMIKYKDLEGNEKWATCSDKVKSYVAKFFKEGDKMAVQGEQQDEFFYITKAENPDYAGGVKKEGEAPKSTSGSFQKTKSPEESERITRLSVLGSASQAVTALTGQVDPNTIQEITLSLYTAMLNKIKE